MRQITNGSSPRGRGTDAFNAFRQRFGGLEVKLPRSASKLKDNHPIIEAIGREAAEKLCFEFFGAQIYVPRAIGDSYLDGIENAYVQAVRNGLTNDEIAKQRGISSRQVRRMMSALGIVNKNHQRRLEAARNSRRDLFPASECREGAILTAP